MDFTYIDENLAVIRDRISGAMAVSERKAPPRILAVTKGVDVCQINHAISRGIDLIGENRVNELLDKYQYLNKDNLEIHFIGHLQSNKVKHIIEKVSMIHSLDSLSLAGEIDKRSRAAGITMEALVEVNIAREPSKFGVMPEETEDFIRNAALFNSLKIKGLMCIPPFGEDNNEYFLSLAKILVDIRAKNIDNVNMELLSMGMSDDYPGAVRHGADIIRLGRALFGKNK